MGFIQSRFNVIVDELADGKQLLYNSYSGIFSVLDVETQEMLNNISNINVPQINDTTSASKLIESMLIAGYIIHDDTDELARIKLGRAIARYNTNTIFLGIAPTMDCNMRCPYCYEGDNVKDVVMTRAVQDRLISFIEQYVSTNQKIQNICVCWYGGEPLLQKEIIFSLSSRITEICNKNNIKRVPGFMTTNGVLLDKETANKIAAECYVTHIQITVDGMIDLHNKRRKLTTGEDSYGIIMENIEECKDIIPIIVRVNVDRENADEIDTLVKHFLYEKGWGIQPTFYLSPVIKADTGCTYNASTCMLGEEFGELEMSSIRASYVANRKTVSNAFFPHRKDVFCKAECLSNFVIDPEGYLYTCYHKIRQSEHCIGNVFEPLRVTKAYADWVLADLHENCEECEYLPMCQGGCAYTRFSTDGPRCFYTYYNYKNVLRLAYDDYLLQKGDIPQVNALRKDTNITF